MKKLLCFFLIAILFMQVALAFVVEVSSVSDAEQSHSQLQEGGEGNLDGLMKKHHPRTINCSYACKRRCSKASRKKMCHRACGSCCKKCHCVPPGTYGNKNMCPCYAKLKTHGNRPKCP